MPVTLSYVVPVYFDTGSRAPLDVLLGAYAEFPEPLLQAVQFVVVDDASPVPIELPTGLRMNVLLARIHERIPWNVPGAKNLGVVLASAHRVLVTDVDHYFDLEGFAGVLLTAVGERQLVTFPRDEDGTELEPHLGTFLTTRSHFLETQGLDEDFAGHYGFDDVFLHRWQASLGTRFRSAPHILRVREGGKANMHSCARDSSFNEALMRTKTTHSGRMLRFRWSIVARASLSES